MKPTPKRLFPCVGCGAPLPCFPSEAHRRRCAACLRDFRSALGTTNAAKKRPIAGATCERRYRNVTYRFVYQPTHPSAPKAGWVPEHRLVMESAIGRLLTAEEVVHHIDHDGLNNDPGNLELIANRGQHLALHHSAEGVAKRLTMYPACACGKQTEIGGTVCWTCWKQSQTCPACGRPNRKMARRDMCHGCYKRLRVQEGRYHQTARPNIET